MNENKYKSLVVIWGAIFLILHAISLVYVVGINPNGYTYMERLITAFVAVIMLALVIIYMVLSLKKKPAGPVIGMIIGAAYIVSLTIIDFIIGICFIISCAGMLKMLNLGKEQKTKAVKESKEQKEN